MVRRILEPIQILKSDGLLLDSREISKTPPYGTVGTTNQFNLNAPMKNRIDYIFRYQEYSRE